MTNNKGGFPAKCVASFEILSWLAKHAIEAFIYKIYVSKELYNIHQLVINLLVIIKCFFM